MRRFPKLLALAALSMFAAPTLACSAPADFTGVWRRDLARSTIVVPRDKSPDTKRIDRITQGPNELVWQWSGTPGAKPDSGTVRTALDGSERLNQVRGRKTRNRANWSGDTLKVLTQGSSGGLGYRIDDRLWLERDGETLILARHARLPLYHQAIERWVFVRERDAQQ